MLDNRTREEKILAAAEGCLRRLSDPRSTIANERKFGGSYRSRRAHLGRSIGRSYTIAVDANRQTIGPKYQLVTNPEAGCVEIVVVEKKLR